MHSFPKEILEIREKTDRRKKKFYGQIQYNRYRLFCQLESGHERPPGIAEIPGEKMWKKEFHF